MGNFTDTITLTNAGDRRFVKEGLRDKVRSVTVEAMPDTGAWILVINEEIREKLGLEIVDKTHSTLANGLVEYYGLTEPVEITWKTRSISLQSLVIPEMKIPLIGALALEGLDLCVDPVHHKLVGVHGDEPMYIVY